MPERRRAASVSIVVRDLTHPGAGRIPSSSIRALPRQIGVSTMRCIRFAMLRPMAALALSLVPLAANAGAGIPKIQHVVIIVQENRSVDNLFHGLNKYLPDADIADSGVDSKGKKIVLTPVPLVTGYDMDHSHTAFVEMYRGGKMTGADLIVCKGGLAPCPANPAFRYVRQSDINSYFEIAENYGFANRMFQSNQGPSFPAHQFLFSGTSQPEPDSPLFASGNVATSNGVVGCIAPPNAFVPMIDPSGDENTLMYPCFEHETLADLLDVPPKDPTHPISWRYYTLSAGSIWSAPDAIEHLCQPAESPPRCTDPHWTEGDVVLWPAQVLVDIHQNDLKAVSWVIPTAQDSDHPQLNTGGGPSWVASIVNAIGNSPYWTNTVILIVWDDWGGWYDHVPPPIDKKYGYYQNGFRVPLLVVSPYTPKGYISQSPHTFGSILRFVEKVFDLGLIPPGNFADSRANDLSDFFNFSAAPRPFTAIHQTIPENQFLDKSRPMIEPDND
jgi:phospholipase C